MKLYCPKGKLVVSCIFFMLSNIASGILKKFHYNVNALLFIQHNYYIEVGASERNKSLNIANNVYFTILLTLFT